ncbi:MAG: hypothetical protein MUD10_02560 [Candidatus Pacebacteria bacterium]|nr:hypothetical protein [Candidatus Paceibacterota bacterium]
MWVKRGKTNWIFIAIVFLSATVTGVYLVSYINDGGVVQGSSDSVIIRINK